MSETTTISVITDLLDQHKKIHSLSVGLTVSAILITVMLTALSQSTVLLWVPAGLSIVLGLIETLLAIRVGFDSNLFRTLGKPHLNTQEELKALDEALIALSMITADKAGRDLQARLQGCMRLFKKQALACALQLFALLLILPTAWI